MTIIQERSEAARSVTPAFVAFSEITVPADGSAALEEAFRQRMGAVDSWPGFQDIQVWSDTADPTAYVMVSWWDDKECFAAYMQSDDHRCSHARIPGGQSRPRPQAFRRYQVVAR